MDLTLEADDVAFRDRIRDVVARRLPEDVRARMLGGESVQKEDIRHWQQVLHSEGLGAIHWPVEYGGLAASPLKQYLFELECALGGAPVQLPFGLRMLAPVLMRFGSPAQRARFLPGMLTGEDWWCQGYSEPGAGSDLASLKTVAVRDGDHYVVNGQKCWNTLGHHADWIFCLVRTDPAAKAQRGISLLLIDMKSPGVTVRPTILLDGSHEINEIFFDGVRVPAENLVGEENQGWTYAKFLLSHERLNIAGVGASTRDLRRVKHLASIADRHGRPLLADEAFRRRLARVEIDLLALEYTNLRVLSGPSDEQSTAIAASILKIRGSEIRQAISELAVETLGERALERDIPAPDPATGITATYLNLRKLSIYGGSNEIQRNIVAQILLGG